MKATTKFFIGVDVSKPYFDASLMKEINHEKQPMETRRFDNNNPGIKTFDKWLKSHKVFFGTCLFTLAMRPI